MPAAKPLIGPAQIKLLERLCLAVGVSGDEREVRAIVLEQVRPLADEVKVDAMGNVLAIRQGTGRGRRLRVMLAAHMDEVGFMLTAEDGDGLYRFELVGGIDVRQLPGKPVLVGRDHTPGVIGARPIHLTTAEERERKIPLDSLRIDLGPGGRARPGDRAVFATPFARLGPSLRARALDNRLGVATLIELLRHAPRTLDLYAAFTVQEEIGLRGAHVAAYAFDPDLAFVLDSTPAYDLPAPEDRENVAYNTRLGFGPAIYTADAGTLSDPRLIRHLTAVAEKARIPYQFRQPGGGGTDAGAIHRQRAGIPSVSVSVPHRYSHTAASIARLDDWKHTVLLMHAALQKLPADILKKPR